MTYDSTQRPEGWQVHRVGQGILIEDGRVLLCGNRWYSAKPLVWTLPGGRAEEGEGIGDALIREFAEETGLRIEVLDLAFVVEAQSPQRRQTYLTCAFLVSRAGGELSCAADPGVEELQFATATEIAALIPSPSIGEPLGWFLTHPQEPMRYWFYPEYTG